MYTARYFASFDAFAEPAARGDNSLAIAHYPWQQDYTPRVYAVLAHGGDALYVFMHAQEKQVRAQIAQHNGNVCTDSCMEFFFMPSPETDNRYFNIEVNPRGVMHVGFGSGRHDRLLIGQDECACMKVAAHVEPGVAWHVSYRVPYAFIREFVQFDGANRYTIKANLYKCGDDTATPHWGCCFAIDTPQPDFHRPEFFRDILFDMHA